MVGVLVPGSNATLLLFGLRYGAWRALVALLVIVVTIAGAVLVEKQLRQREPPGRLNLPPGSARFS